MRYDCSGRKSGRARKKREQRRQRGWADARRDATRCDATRRSKAGSLQASQPSSLVAETKRLSSRSLCWLGYNRHEHLAASWRIQSRRFDLHHKSVQSTSSKQLGVHPIYTDAKCKCSARRRRPWKPVCALQMHSQAVGNHFHPSIHRFLIRNQLPSSSVASLHYRVALGGASRLAGHPMGTYQRSCCCPGQVEEEEEEKGQETKVDVHYPACARCIDCTSTSTSSTTSEYTLFTLLSRNDDRQTCA